MSILDNIINRIYILVRFLLVLSILSILVILIGPIIGIGIIGILISCIVHIFVDDIKMKDDLLSWRKKDEHIH